MAAALWLHDALVDGGCDPRPPVPGWEQRGKPGLNARGLVAHHIGIGGTALEPGLRVVTHGRPGLVNALCHVHLARDGRPRVVAAGVAWHAGAGAWRGLTGNSSVLGIEAEGTTGQAMSQAWHDGYEVTVAALLAGLAREEWAACSHSEWAGPRKPDAWALNTGPGAMAGFRARCRQRMFAPAPIPPPSEEDTTMIVPAVVHDSAQSLALRWYVQHDGRTVDQVLTGDMAGLSWWTTEIERVATLHDLGMLEFLFARLAAG